MLGAYKRTSSCRHDTEFLRGINQAGPLMDLESAAAVLGVHYQTAYRWVRTGLLPAMKVGAGYELDPDHVATIAEERRHDRPAPARPAPDLLATPGALAEALASGDDVAARPLIEC